MRNEQFGALVSEGIASVAHRWHKTRAGVLLEMREALASTSMSVKDSTLAGWCKGYLPKEPELIAFFTRYCVRQGRVDRSWAERLLYHAHYPEREHLLGELFSGTVHVPTPLLAEHTPNTAFHEGRRMDDPAIPHLSVLTRGLVGRESILIHLKERFFGGQGLTLCALQGLPGVGKTSLALELAHDPEVQARFSDGLLWAGLGRTSRLFEILSRWGRVLGLTPEQSAKLTTLETWADALCTAIGTRRFLFVLDDAWRSEDALACQVGGAQCGYLFTTRFLNVALQVAGANILPVSELGELEGLELLGRFAPQLIASESEVARRLVQVVGGLPLALTLMGKYLQRHAYSGQPRRLQAALERLGQRAERLQLGQPQTPLERHPSLSLETPLSLQASIGLSVAALGASARAMLQTLTVFPPKPTSFPEEAALWIAKGTAETLDTLVDAGLVESIGQGRYTLHQVIMDYASQQGEHTEAAERFVAWAVDMVETLHCKAQTLDQELSLLLAAFSLAAVRGINALLVRGVTCLAPILEGRGLLEIAEQLLVQGQRAAQETGDMIGGLRITRQLAQLVQMRGDYTRAEALIQEGLHLARNQQANEHLSALLHLYGVVALKRGTCEQAEQRFHEALTLAQASEDRERISAVLISLGSLYCHYGNTVQAEAAYQTALRIAHEQGDQAQIVAVLQGLAGVAYYQGDYAQSRVWLQEALALARSQGTSTRILDLLNNLGTLALDQGDLQEAEHALVEGLALARAIGYKERLCILLTNLGEVGARSGCYQEAYTVFKEGLALAETLSHRLLSGSLLLHLAETALLEGAWQQAERWLQQGVMVAQELQLPNFSSRALLVRGDLEAQRSQWEEAANSYRAVAASDSKGQRREYLGLANYGLAQIAAAQGKWQEAQYHGQASLTCLESIGYYKAAEVRQWLDTFHIAGSSSRSMSSLLDMNQGRCPPINSQITPSLAGVKQEPARVPDSLTSPSDGSFAK